MNDEIINALENARLHSLSCMCDCGAIHFIDEVMDLMKKEEGQK
jgi:hypothetical protein